MCNQVFHVGLDKYALEEGIHAYIYIPSQAMSEHAVFTRVIFALAYISLLML
jgi:hypothetical protein